jgi:hypothetical protein
VRISVAGDIFAFRRLYAVLDVVGPKVYLMTVISKTTGLVDSKNGCIIRRCIGISQYDAGNGSKFAIGWPRLDASDRRPNTMIYWRFLSVEATKNGNAFGFSLQRST